MKADEMALECARQLKAYCDAVDCSDCVFNTDTYCCGLNHRPCDWSIPETIGSPMDDDGK